ncbi:hypothetical protein EVAR_72302_1 [Eumeta japonica]|uniref:Uncharacterized protein n=1 Tax=Eumeta variegata TaxID=151549 RepID=A0A4C1SPH7_EUMVA|nr:hypothetical protein EVAR_72302_1 [Eumeta japonica]
MIGIGRCARGISCSLRRHRALGERARRLPQKARCIAAPQSRRRSNVSHIVLLLCEPFIQTEYTIDLISINELVWGSSIVYPGRATPAASAPSAVHLRRARTRAARPATTPPPARPPQAPPPRRRASAASFTGGEHSRRGENPLQSLSEQRQMKAAPPRGAY